MRLGNHCLRHESEPGLPDGSFSNPKYKLGKILEGAAMEDVGIFYGHSVSFMAIGHILRLFGIS
jgi:hypothetical protein